MAEESEFSQGRVSMPAERLRLTRQRAEVRQTHLDALGVFEVTEAFASIVCAYRLRPPSNRKPERQVQSRSATSSKPQALV
jgi:hypothetical protein